MNKNSSGRFLTNTIIFPRNNNDLSQITISKFTVSHFTVFNLYRLPADDISLPLMRTIEIFDKSTRSFHSTARRDLSFSAEFVEQSEYKGVCTQRFGFLYKHVSMYQNWLGHLAQDRWCLERWKSWRNHDPLVLTVIPCRFSCTGEELALLEKLLAMSINLTNVEIYYEFCVLGSKFNLLSQVFFYVLTEIYLTWSRSLALCIGVLHHSLASRYLSFTGPQLADIRPSLVPSQLTSGLQQPLASQHPAFTSPQLADIRLSLVSSQPTSGLHQFLAS